MPYAILVFIASIIGTALSAQYQPAKKKFVFTHWETSNPENNQWDVLPLAGPLQVDFSNADTIFFSVDRSRYFFTKKTTTAFNDEPKEILGFRLVGVYESAGRLPGISILFYLDEKKGLLRKYFFSPHNLNSAEYLSNEYKNPFRQMKWPQSMHNKVILNDTIDVY